MRYLIIVFLFLINFYTSKGQNLVPNPSFEDFNPCGDADVGCDLVKGIGCKSSCCAAALPERQNLINGATHNWWSVHLLLPPLYFNECIYKNFKKLHPEINGRWYIPRTGKAFIIVNTFGAWDADTTDLRQYAQVKLTDSLRSGCKYEVIYYALLTKNSSDFFYGNVFRHDIPQVPSDGLSLYLSKDSLHVDDYRLKYQALTDYTPQVTAGRLLTDSVNYQKVSGIFKAQGGEQWLVIGNFRDNQHTLIRGNGQSQSFYSIDDVSVQLWRPDVISFSDTTICADSSITLTLPDGLSNFQWSTGSTAKQITVSAGGNYTVQASNGCETLFDQFTIHTKPRYTGIFDIGRDTLFCTTPISLPLTAPSGFNSYKWSNGSTLDHMNAMFTGKYKVTAKYECGSLSDSISITLFQQPDTLLIPAKDTSICSNETLDLQVYHPSKYSSFLWNDGSTNNHLNINQPGLYSVKAKTNTGCIVKDTIAIQLIYPTVIYNFPDTIACQDVPLNLTLNSTVNERVKWFDGDVKNSYSFYTTGTYWVTLSNVCYSATDTMVIDFLDCSLNIPNLITNNQDERNDYFIIETTIQRPLDLTVYNSWGIEIFKEENYKGQWGGTDLKAGIYFYQITDSLLNKNYKGWVQVVQ